MKKYKTGLMATNEVEQRDYDYESIVFKGNKFTIHFEKNKIPNCKANSYEVIIYCNSVQRAIAIHNFILSSFRIYSNHKYHFGTPCISASDKAENKLAQHIYGEEYKNNFYMHIPGIVEACKIALLVSRRKDYQYAIAKYEISCQILSQEPIDLDPTHATEHIGVPNSPYTAAWYAASIVQSYSVIEQINLEIRSSNKNPIMNYKTNEWYPEKRIEFENRLKSCGVNIDKHQYWIRRGKPTNIERNIHTKKTKKLMVNNSYIRDTQIKVIDAIRIAWHLRNKVAAHRINDIAMSLNGYDCENIRLLARRLLLSSIGYHGFE